MMSALESLHECHVSLTVSASTEGHNGCVTLRLCAAFDVLPGSERAKEVSTTIEWPSKYGRSFEGEVFNALYVLDFMISEVYQQRFLPEV
jgi:hypothetical protein